MSRVLEERWTKLWVRAGGAGDGRMQYEDLCTRYAEPHRAYHTLAHIECCLDEYHRGREDVDGFFPPSEPLAVEFALLYHDIIYDTRAQDNEELSARYLVEVLKAAGVTSFDAELAASYVRVTAHNKMPLVQDEKIVLDVDLSVLGQSPDTFDEYERHVRQEYDWVPEDAFRTGRARILERFLARPRIYHLDYFYERYERAARENLRRSLATLV